MRPAAPEIFVGIDVSKAKLDVAVGRDAAVFTVANTPEGNAALVARLPPLRPPRMVMEATGGLEVAAAAALAAPGCRCWSSTPARPATSPRRWASWPRPTRSTRGRWPTSAAATKAEPRPLPDADGRELDALLDRRRQLVGMRTMEQNRLAAPGRAAGSPRPGVAPALAGGPPGAGGPRAGGAHPLQPGVAGEGRPAAGHPGDRAGPSRTLLAGLPELGRLSNQAAALAGLAPRADDSGRRRGPRHIAGGRQGGAGGAVHGGAVGATAQPGVAGVRRSAGGGGEAAEGGAGGGGAEAGGHRQRDPAQRQAVGRDDGRAAVGT